MKTVQDTARNTGEICTNRLPDRWLLSIPSQRMEQLTEAGSVKSSPPRGSPTSRKICLEETHRYLPPVGRKEAQRRKDKGGGGGGAPEESPNGQKLW